MTDLKALLERVKTATGPDHDLDADLWLAVVPGASRKNLLADWPEEAPLWEYHDAERNVMFRAGLVPSLTASIDAALSLVERVMPGWHFNLTNFPWPVADMITPTADDKEWAKHFSAKGATLALAILSALLTALVAKGGPDGER